MSGAGFNKPSSVNQAAFERAVQEITSSSKALLDVLVTSGSPKDRATEAAKAKARNQQRFG
jgi:hypothetical protein